MSQDKVLVIDDEPDIRELFSLTFRRMNLHCDLAATVEEGLRCIRNNQYFLALTDMCLPDGDGIEVIRFIQREQATLPVAVITAYGNVEGAVNSLKAGAFDYVSKPVDLGMLKALVNTALSMYHRPEQKENVLIGESDVMLELKQKILKLARSQAPVYIHGESGVGKELAAHLIHAYSPRNEQPLIAVNCAAIPSELMESEFFGHKKGSFTGAFSDKQGLFEAAHGGTLFLDEVAELSLAMQVKLLRAIQEKVIKPIGAAKERLVDIRILSASNKNLSNEIAAGHFREELYYRINVLELRVPTLRERISDIPLLADHILKKNFSERGEPPRTLSASALKILKSYAFPGNVRELENILERATTLSHGEVITAEDIELPETQFQAFKNLSTNGVALDQKLLAHEKSLILNALNQTKWNRTAAARLLGISFRTLRYRLKKLGLD